MSEQLTLLQEVMRRIYYSDNGKSLSAKDWLHIKERIEILNDQDGGRLLGISTSGSLPVLLQSVDVVNEALEKRKTGNKKSDRLVTMCLTAVRESKADFVFQLLRTNWTEVKRARLGPQTLPILESVLADLGISLGMELGEHEAYLNTFTLSEKVRFEGIWAELPTEGRSVWLVFEFDSSTSYQATFSRQRWSLSFLEGTVAAENRHDLKVELASYLRSIWEKSPERLKGSTLTRVYEHELISLGLPAGDYRLHDTNIWERDYLSDASDAAVTQNEGSKDEP